MNKVEMIVAGGEDVRTSNKELLYRLNEFAETHKIISISLDRINSYYYPIYAFVLYEESEE